MGKYAEIIVTLIMKGKTIGRLIANPNETQQDVEKTLTKIGLKVINATWPVLNVEKVQK